MKQWNPKDYDAWYETPLGKLSDSLEKGLIFSMPAIKRGGTALDIGCGTGIYSVELAKRGAVTTGIDESREMLKRARARALKDGLQINFVSADALRLPFPDNYFDLVLSVGALCFIKEREKALLEMSRVLKPGGSLIAGVLNKWSPWAFFRRIKGLFKETIYNRADFISPPEMELSLSMAGFKVKELKTCLFFFPVNSRMYLRLAAFLERPGRMITPRMGAFLTVLAKKA